ncbi:MULTISPECIES: phosphoethanolamine transferase [unclassified Nitratiruptor]|uniref:phosphoethanolamine transferase n=1 Tax=unclassified Nitratiruptor TaxID=2624044 RepID=UPI001915E4FF|nr:MULTISPECIES: phosphoethanolamine transferase [unclassified Nitratiruptor]BCD60722.1 hypothetical protein NitYY0810_C1500 [Nitratiruptor sp. YY08-10]BCD64654.1 hypothetical protein NitYY0814_C1508 [Nitratiruptor sp. YY08-14]
MKKIAKHFLYSFYLSLIFLLPDLVYALFHPNYYTFRLPSFIKEYSALYLISFLILLIRNYWIRVGFALFIAALSFVQLMHFSYFHSYILPYEVGLSNQIPEMLDTLNTVIPYVKLPLIIFFAQAALLLYALKKLHTISMRYASLILVLLLAIGPVSALKRKKVYNYMPKTTSLSFKNSFTAISWYIAKNIFQHQKPQYKTFKPYIVKKMSKPLADNIIVVMGESLTKDKMSLYGYPKETTPYLDKLKNSPRFLYTWGHSGGVTTDVSIPTFFTLKREPQNIQPLITNSTNLLKLAKDQNYSTSFITMQSLYVIGGVLSDFSDTTKVLHGYDEKLAHYLDTITKKKKNFIVLHQRNSHSAYEHYTPPSFYYYPFKNLPFHEYMLGSYLNSIRYTDFVLHSIFKKADAMPGCTLVFFTSDHGEMMGEKSEHGRYGHVYLGFEDTKVPMIIYASKGCNVKQFHKEFNLSRVISHYQFGKMIAKALGYEIINPNEDVTYYINGIDISGNAGFISYKKRHP